MTAEEKSAAAGYEDVILFADYSYDDALIGITECGRAVYDCDKMVEWLMQHTGWDMEQAVEWIEYNTIGALPNAGPAGPVVMYSL